MMPIASSMDKTRPMQLSGTTSAAHTAKQQKNIIFHYDLFLLGAEDWHGLPCIRSLIRN